MLNHVRGNGINFNDLPLGEFKTLLARNVEFLLINENDTTIIAIAHRLTTLKNCDKIIVLNNGQIEEESKFKELINNAGLFSDMYYGRVK